MTADSSDRSVLYVLCPDLMMASRFVSTDEVDVFHARTFAAAQRLAASSESRRQARLWLVDGSAFAQQIAELRALVGQDPIVGFAPHIAEDLLKELSVMCDRVVVRGAAVKNYPTLVRELARL